MADEGTNTATATNVASSPTVDNDPLRPVILETTKEAYLLSPNILSPTESATSAERVYDIALILETEVVVEDEQTVAEAEAETAASADATLLDNKVEEAILPTAPTKVSDVDDPKEAVSTAVAAETPAATPPVPSADATSQAAEATSTKQPSMVVTKDDLVEPDTASKTKTLFAEPGSSPPPPSRASPVHSPEPEPMNGHDNNNDHDAPPSSPLPTDTSMLQDKDNDDDNDDKDAADQDQDKASILLEDDIPKPQFSVQVLQRNLARGMFRFENDSVYVRDPSGDGMEAEWAIQVKNWKWAPKGARERLIDAV